MNNRSIRKKQFDKERKNKGKDGRGYEGLGGREMSDEGWIRDKGGWKC